MSDYTREQLKSLQDLSLEEKVIRTQSKIIEWYNYFNGNVYVSFSGGKDSTVLLHLVRQIFPDVPAVFSDTGLEYPEIREFVKTFDNVEIVKPKMSFTDVIKNYGYPLISKEVAQTIYCARKRERERERRLGSVWNFLATVQAAHASSGKRIRRISVWVGTKNLT